MGTEDDIGTSDCWLDKFHHSAAESSKPLSRLGHAAVAHAALMIGLMSAAPGHAQSANPSIPTTRILAIGTLNPGVDPAAARAILPKEVKETVTLYLDGKVDQWYSLQGRPGVAFILNMNDPAAAQ